MANLSYPHETLTTASHTTTLHDALPIWPYVTKAVHRIELGASPIVLVNGSKDADYAKEDIAFEKRSVWKILVGGAKLSRGFTVEGLTVSVYTRVTLAADTLMQMGRWFGYRKGYRDLVRIYLGTQIEKRGVRNGVDLYEAFTSIARDEEDFRTELEQYAGYDDEGAREHFPSTCPLSSPSGSRGSSPRAPTRCTTAT